ncbi:ImmA/IrrE family metallo-endopeptidase [Leptospira bouyouniensis]|uniref:ImmA/IrrE family metallo-endopeptidase n=1 Tax=Leptospira bouyouniensis TaxID=2484911 RepID=A0A7I0HRH6_9LEPT|nr:ImmA/IrrE family metallo-endopeptidase [Leptospira bouyouniensis]TGL04978.1 ImmA/IrrE family metallo-endopeptidase [Leptospira bouyouniensis]
MITEDKMFEQLTEENVLGVYKKPNISYFEPKQSLYSKSAIKKIAEWVAEKLEFSVGGSIESIVKKIGGELVFLGPSNIMQVGDEQLGAILIHEQFKFQIFIPNYTLEFRDRFTIAHELGHYFLHYIFTDERKPLIAARGVSNKVEAEANHFAACFLMPEDEFRNDYSKMNLSQLSSKYQVSKLAINVRASYLGIQL